MFFTIDRRIDAVVRRLAHQLVIPGFVLGIEGEKKHSQSFDLIDAHARMVLQPSHFMNRHVIDEIRLAGLQCRQAARHLR